MGYRRRWLRKQEEAKGAATTMMAMEEEGEMGRGGGRGHVHGV